MTRSHHIVDLRKQAASSSRRKGGPAEGGPSRASSLRTPARAVSFAEGRRSPLRAKRRQIRLIALATLCLVLLVIGIGVSYASHLPRYTFNTVAVEGARAVDPADVQRFAEEQLHAGGWSVIARNSIVTFDTEALAEQIVAAFPQIKSVDISRESLLSTELLARVEERAAWAFWCTDISQSQCYDMDDTGFIFSRSSTGRQSDTRATTAASSSVATSTSAAPVVPLADRLLFVGGVSAGTDPLGQSFAPGHLSGMRTFFDRIIRLGFTPVGARVMDDGKDFDVLLTQGWNIKASYGQDIDTLARNLELILGAETLKAKTDDLLYVDLRWGDRAYYKLKTSTTTPSR